MADRKPGRVKSQARRPRKVRDYASEYARRIARALSLGLTRTQARGHPRQYEGFISRRKRPPIDDERLQRALKILGREKNMRAAAKAARISPERLKRIAQSKGAILKTGRRWVIDPAVPRRTPLFSRGRAVEVTVLGEPASKVGTFMNAVRRFSETNDYDLVAPFVGQSVTDTAGKAHPFETNPNTLYRLTAAGEGTFEQVYRLVV
jgi:hypothetical protein